MSNLVLTYLTFVLKYFSYLRKISPVILLASIIPFSNGCDNRAFGQRADSLFLVTAHLDVKYDLKSPTEKYFLPYVLEEISGLSFHAPNSVLAVDDETGRVFEYNFVKRDITHSMRFHPPDDFEGVEMVGSTVYALKSDGDLFQFKYDANKTPKAIKYENELGKKNNTEGLGYDPVKNRLLIACKDKAEIDKNRAKGRAVYSFDLKTKKLIEAPFVEISSEMLEDFWEQNKDFNYEKERIKFKPSAIAFNPKDKLFYMLSSVGKLLLVVNRDGQLMGSYPISPRVLGQPEGICFSADGDMYISSEGEGDRGYILKFEINK